MKFSRVVSLFAALAIVLMVVPSNPVAHANQTNVLPDSQTPLTMATRQLAPAKQALVFGKAEASYSTGDSAGPMVVADVNGDGKPDVLVLDSSAVSVWLGNGDGTLKFSAGYDVGYVISIAVKDVNGDGKPDLVAALYSETGNPDSGGIAILFGNGDGTFQNPVIYASGGYGAVAIAIADVNGDGYADLLVANQCQSYDNCFNGFPIGNVVVLLGEGDGTFHASGSYDFGVGTESIVVADVNGDGSPDLLVAHGDGAVTVLLNNHDGTFQNPVSYNANGYPTSFAVEDVNGDGKPDVIESVICANGCPNNGVSVLLGNGDGTFQPPILTSSPASGYSIAVQDVDGDGEPDVVIAGYVVPYATVLLGNGDGTFQPPQKYQSGLKSNSAVAIADLNGDGKPDLVMSGACSKTPCLDFQILPNIFDVSTVTAVTSSPNPSVVNQLVTFTATVTSEPKVPDGDVITFSASKIKLGTGITKNGIASFATSFLKAKTYTIKASYPGDLFHKSSSAVVRQLVNH
jgi:hypothetical protein